MRIWIGDGYVFLPMVSHSYWNIQEYSSTVGTVSSKTTAHPAHPTVHRVMQ